jgi:hypothetical protein
VIVGIARGVTFTVKVAVAVAAELFVTVSVKVELVATQFAATFAVTLPAASTLMLLMVTPVPVKGVAVTTSVLAGWDGSLTVAICVVALAPCCLTSGAAAVMVGVPSLKQTVTSFSVGVAVLRVVLKKALYFR